jgi:hypothetical protein
MQLKSKFLQDHFYDDDVPYDIFIESYKAAVRVLNNPELYPNSDYGYFVTLEEELMLQAPTWCGYCR